MLFLLIKTAITGQSPRRVDVYDIDLSYLIAVREYVYHGLCGCIRAVIRQQKIQTSINIGKTLRRNS